MVIRQDETEEEEEEETRLERLLNNRFRYGDITLYEQIIHRQRRVWHRDRD